MNQGNDTTYLPDGSLLMKTNGKYVFYINLLNYNSARFFTSQNADEYFIDFISRTVYELNKYNSEESSKQRLLTLMPKSVLAQSPDNRRWYFYLDKDHYDRNMPYTEQKKDENVSTFINYTIGILQDDGLLTRPTEERTDVAQPRLYDQLTEAEKIACNRLKNLIPYSIVVVNLNNGVYTFYLDRNTEYTRQLQGESFIEFIERTIEKLYDSKRIPEPDVAKDNGLGMRTPNISEGTKEPEGLMRCGNTVLPPIPIPEGHVRVVLYLCDFDEQIETSFPARVNKKDRIILGDWITDEKVLSAAAQQEIEEREAWKCVQIEWERDEEGSYQIAYIK